MRVRGRDKLLNVQPLKVITIVNTCAQQRRKQKQEDKRATYWFQSLNEQPFFVGNIVLERSLRGTKAEEKKRAISNRS